MPIYMVAFTLEGLSSFPLLVIMANQILHEIEIQVNPKLLSNNTERGPDSSI